VHRYDFDLATTLRLRELIDEYGQMHRLKAMTPQRRGQRFNDFIADLLRCWGLGRVEANVRSVGEIDVTFAVDGARFILEAKWEQGPIDFGALAKFRGRIIQRLAGTRGVFLSMSGYTDEAQSDLLRGQQPDMLLLDRTHLEAMLSGLFSPGDLLAALLDRASYCGEVWTPVGNLLVRGNVAPLPTLALGRQPDEPSSVIDAAPGVRAEVSLHGTRPQNAVIEGVAVDPLGRLLLTTAEGVVRADPETGALGWAVPIAGCRRGAFPCADGSILVVCGETVLRWDGSEFRIAAGGFTGGTSLLPGPDGEVWVFDYKRTDRLGSGSSVTLTRLGSELGQEERHTLDFRAGIWSAVWLSGRRFFLAGDGHFAVVDLDKTTTVPIDDRLISPHPDQRGAIRIDEHTVMTATRHGTVYRIDVETGKSTLVAKLDMLAMGCDLAATGRERAYVLEHQGGSRAFVPIVVALSGYAS